MGSAVCARASGSFIDGLWTACDVARDHAAGEDDLRAELEKVRKELASIREEKSSALEKVTKELEEIRKEKAAAKPVGKGVVDKVVDNKYGPDAVVKTKQGKFMIPTKQEEQYDAH